MEDPKKDSLMRNRYGWKRTKWRKRVLKRDDYKCQMCGNVEVRFLQIHHIKPWHKYPKLRWKINNGIALCETCHQLAERLKFGFKKVNNIWFLKIKTDWNLHTYIKLL